MSPSQSPSKRTPADSVVEMTEIVLPEDTNARGTIFGGRVLALIDKCAGVAAMRHSRRAVLTVSMDSVVFHNTVRVGNVLALSARVNAAFTSSMEIEVEVHSENPYTGVLKLTTKAFVTMVAIDENGRPVKVPELQATDDEERAREQKARERRERRLKGC